MTKQQKHNVYVYIDGNNLYQNARNYFDWRLDYKKFYTFLVEKYETEISTCLLGIFQSITGCIKSYDALDLS